MSLERLNILCVLPDARQPSTPLRPDSNARLMTQLARRHDLTAVMLFDAGFDADECHRAIAQLL